MEAIGQTGQAIGILAKDGIVLASEKRITTKLLESMISSEKTYKIDEHICCAVAGLASDANLLINYCRLSAQRYLLRYDQPIPVEQLLQQVCDLKQGYTQYGGAFVCFVTRSSVIRGRCRFSYRRWRIGLRPFGASFIFAGWDRHFGFQLYQSDPSGNYGGWKATAIGGHSGPAQSILKTEWKDSLSLEEAQQLAIKVMTKTLDSTTLSSEKRALRVCVRAAGRCGY
jgi:20S proteasome subunit alpha 3